MSSDTPLGTIMTLIDARARNDVAAALACYVPGATVVLAPGKSANEPGTLEAFITASAALPLIIDDHEIVESGDVALHVSSWSIGPAAGESSIDVRTGRTADILLRQADGRWLIAVDNPWGVAILDRG